MPITHKPKAGALLTGTEYEAADAHEGTVVVDHDDLTGVQADQHHNQSHAHNGGDGSGTVAHSALTSITADDHHNQLHAATHATGQPDALTAANVGAAPSTVDYLVGTASAGLSAEIAVGTTPGGELGGTWASPTVDATHSGSAHHAEDHASRHAPGGADALAALGSDFLVGTATGNLSGEIAVGTTPGGELGNTWASPTVDATHSGSAHTDFIAKTLVDAKGDIVTASADNTPAILTVGANDTILMADSAAGTGLKWVASATPSTQAFGDAAAVGTADTFTRGDHKHAMPANPVAGFTPVASQSGISVNSLALSTALTLPANGGSVAIAIAVPATMNVQEVQVKNLDGGTARAWRWDLYVQNGATNVLDRVAESNGSDSFTGAGAAIRTLAGLAPPYVISPGIYWLVIQSTHATSSFAFGTTAGVSLASGGAQTKTTTNPNGATLDFTAATWTKNNSGMGAVIRGRVFGESTAF